MNDIALREWQKRNVDNVELTGRDRRFLQKLDQRGFISFREYEQYSEVETNRFVGLIQLENRVLRIEPKIENHRLLWMIDYGARLDILHTLDIESLVREGGFTLPDLIFIVFVRQVDRMLRQGLHKNYVSVREKSKHLKGKLLLYENVLQNHYSSTGIWVEYDELTYDILENRIILSAMRIVRQQSKVETVKRSAQRCLSGIRLVVKETPINSYDCDRVIFNRLNRHYEVVINLARLIVEYSGLEEISHPGNARIYSFLVNMDSIFQNFLSRLLREYLTEYDVLNLPRYSQFVKERETGKSRSIQPDFLLSRNISGGKKKLIVVDAKYKTNEKPSLSDLYQIFFYSLAISGRRGLAYLVYPGIIDSVKATVDLQGNESSETIATVKILKIPLVKVINYLSMKQFRRIKELLRELFQERSDSPV